MDEKNIIALYSSTSKQFIQTETSIDTTRNLSVFIVAGMMYFTFGFPLTSSHLIAILGSVTVFVLQIFESSRYRIRFQLQRRLREFEKYFLSPSSTERMDPEQAIAKTFAERPPSWLYFFAATSYQSYILIFLSLDVCWFAKLYLAPVAATTWAEFLDRPAFGFLPGWFFFAFAGVFWATYFTLAIWYKKASKKYS